MPRYYFDVHEPSTKQIDDTGSDLPDLDAVRAMAMRTLPDIARHEIPRDGDHQAFVVQVTDEDGKAVYSATLTYTGVWLRR